MFSPVCVTVHRLVHPVQVLSGVGGKAHIVLVLPGRVLSGERVPGGFFTKG